MKGDKTSCDPGCPLESTEWTIWSSCSEPCDGGRALRTRQVRTDCGPSCTLQTLTESLTCNLKPCSCPGMPPQTEWSPWTSCSATKSCGGNGVKTRARRVAINQGGSCHLENRTLVKSCHTEACPCPHLPTSWSEWTRCTASCGGGRQRRVREEIWGAGSLCEKHPAEQIKACNTFSCPAKCLWWEFTGGMVFKGFASNTPRLQCYDDQGVLPPEARNYFVGMGSEYIEEISPVGSVCGACVLFTSLEGKVGRIFVL